MRSNFVPNLGVKCESIFDALRSEGRSGKLVGIAHLVDAFGHEDVETVTAVTHNDEIDDALVARAKTVMERDDLDLLALQLLSVDQTGHARGSYNSEYLDKIEGQRPEDFGLPGLVQGAGLPGKCHGADYIRPWAGNRHWRAWAHESNRDLRAPAFSGEREWNWTGKSMSPDR